MTGANAKAKVTYIAQYAGAQDSHKVMGVISLADGGELTVNRIYKRESTTSSTSESAWNAVKDKVTNTMLYLTFDGGILKTGQAGEFFQSADGSRVPDRVLVYEKGATIDTDGKHARVCRRERRARDRGGHAGRQDLWKHEGGGHIHHAARLPAVPYARGQRRR